MIARRFLPAVVIAVLCALASAQTARGQTDAGPTLTQVLKRGYLICGVTATPGFAENTEEGEWRGFDVDFCRALAAAIFDDPTKVFFMQLSAKERVLALQGGWVDLLASAAPWAQSRDAASHRVIYAAVSLHDGQSFLVRRQRSFASARDLSGVTICVQVETPYEFTLASFFRSRKTPYATRGFATFEEAVADYEAGQCDALTADASTLHGVRANFAAPAEHAVLPDMLSKAPHGPLLRQGDDQWLNIVRWTLFAMLNAEELQVSMGNADEALKSGDPDIRLLFGLDGDRGASLGLPGNWAYRIVKHVGNYADVFNRNLGRNSTLGMDRRWNALWNKGGLMFAPPVR